MRATVRVDVVPGLDLHSSVGAAGVSPTQPLHNARVLVNLARREHVGLGLLGDGACEVFLEFVGALLEPAQLKGFEVVPAAPRSRADGSALRAPPRASETK